MLLALGGAMPCDVAMPRVGLAADDTAKDAAREIEQARTRYATEVSHLADWCRDKNLVAESRKTRDLVRRPEPFQVVVPVLPRDANSLRVPEGVRADVAEWYRRALKLRSERAAALYGLAQRAVRRHQPALAYSLAFEAIRADPDHEGARRVFGYQKYQNQWRTPYEISMLQSGMIWRDKFGWISKQNAPRYDRGERLLGSTWIDEANDIALHQDILAGWDIETEHYRIRTNHSIEAGVALGVKLENLHRLWREMFIAYYATEADIEALFFAKPSSARSPADRSVEPPRFEVVYFRDKGQYHRFLKPVMPEAAISMGLYVAENRTAYFYAGSEDSERTMHHEATHQLFQQSRRVADNVGKKANFWLIEGIAMYMETLRRQGENDILGGLDDTRMEAARYHLAEKDFFLPFDKLVRLGMQDLQSDRQIAKLYSQMAAMTSFLVHYENGRYRDALVSCLASIYNGNQDPELLARQTGASYAELDEQYRAYMKAE